ncbi:multidrug resistance protein 2-like [Lacerta agilis]|uniref:multidrug resistance protein 2-like n=1 Tax=Lacerta agilis TaxID=80427 RepID=UPI00141A3034|nr:multidrug resistance protein 2-like [Lacerta agilis]
MRSYTVNPVSKTEPPGNGYDNPAFYLDEEPAPNGRLKKKKKKKKKNEKPEKKGEAVGFFELFHFADGLDITLMIVGLIAAATAGTGQPLLIIVFGQMTNSFVATSHNNKTEAALANISGCPPSDIENDMAT